MDQSSKNRLLSVMKKPEWSQKARCRGVDPEEFFPTRGESVEVLRRFCGGCSVELHCREYAINNNVLGFWGGTTRHERIKVQKKRKKAGTDESLRSAFKVSGQGSGHLPGTRGSHRKASVDQKVGPN